MYQRWPSFHLRLSTTSGATSTGSTLSSQPAGRNVNGGVSPPLTKTSSRYLPAARSARTRAPLAELPLLMYDTGIPYALWKPSTIAWRHVSIGGPSTTTEPSAFAASTSAFSASLCAPAGAVRAAAASATAPAIAARRLRSGSVGMEEPPPRRAVQPAQETGGLMLLAGK